MGFPDATVFVICHLLIHQSLMMQIFKLGATAFEDPVVHLAMIEDEVVRQRHWLTHTQLGVFALNLLLKVGATLYGSGYVLMSYLQGELDCGV